MLLHISHVFQIENNFLITFDFKVGVMNKKIITSMGLPIVIRNKAGKMATIELNNNDCIVCRYHPNNAVYLFDAKIEKWYPHGLIKKIIYDVKVRLLSWIMKDSLNLYLPAIIRFNALIALLD